MGFDLARLDLTKNADAGAWSAVLHPATGAVLEEEGGPVRLLLRGVDSSAWRQAVRDTQRRFASASGKPEPDDEVIRAAFFDQLAAVTVAWERIDLDGQPLPCTRENAATLYGRFVWLADQAFAFISDRGHYLPVEPAAEGA